MTFKMRISKTHFGYILNIKTYKEVQNKEKIIQEKNVLCLNHIPIEFARIKKQEINQYLHILYSNQKPTATFTKFKQNKGSEKKPSPKSNTRVC